MSNSQTDCVISSEWKEHNLEVIFTDYMESSSSERKVTFTIIETATKELQIYRNGMLCKSTLLRKVFTGANVPPCVFGNFAMGKHVDGCSSLAHCFVTYTIVFVSMYRINWITTGLSCLHSTLEQASQFSVLIVLFTCKHRH